MPQQHSVVDFSLSEPGLLISGGEDFHSDTLPLPLTPPHFTITALTWTTARGEQFKMHTSLFSNNVEVNICVKLKDLLMNTRLYSGRICEYQILSAL